MSVWDSPELALSHERQASAEAHGALRRDQASWLSGYLTALGHDADETADLLSAARADGGLGSREPSERHRYGRLQAAALKDEHDLLIVASTHGEGDPSRSAKSFFEFLESRKAPKLAGKRFVGIASGDLAIRTGYVVQAKEGKTFEARPSRQDLRGKTFDN